MKTQLASSRESTGYLLIIQCFSQTNISYDIHCPRYEMFNTLQVQTSATVEHSIRQIRQPKLLYGTADGLRDIGESILSHCLEEGLGVDHFLGTTVLQGVISRSHNTIS